MYRFRKVSDLLDGFNELKNQEIYFASPEQLNDPMEGFRDLFWKGDPIVWKNFLIIYAKSLEYALSLSIILGNRKLLDEKDILVSSSHRPNQTPESIRLVQTVIDRIFKIDFISQLPQKLAERKSPIRKDELLCYLQIAHIYIYNTICDVLFEYRLLSKPFPHETVNELTNQLKQIDHVVTLTNKMELEGMEDATVLFTAITHTNQQLHLIRQYESPKASANTLFLLAEFPEKFIARLEILLYPEWYSASFMTACDNAAVWGHYGAGHTGVCLKFKTYERKEDDKKYFRIFRENGYNGSGPTFNWVEHDFYPITYSDKFQEIDFFRSIARLSRGILEHEWYSDENKNLSPCGNHLRANEDKWRDEYWDNFFKCNAIKSNAWAYECEHRLILTDSFTDYSDTNSRKLKYQFEDLEAIIFGIKTSVADKIKIIRIIEEKCKAHGRMDFDFYQAYYSSKAGKIETDKLGMIKFSLKC